MTTPFSEVNQFEQGREADSFFSTGSVGSIGETPGSFSKQLRNKEQIRLTFPVKSKTTMLPNSSSIYYFNFVNGSWNIPTNARSEHSGTFQNFAYRTIWYPASGSTGYQSTNGSLFLEDYKGFDPYGLPLVSGSLDIYRQSAFQNNQTIDGISKLSTEDPATVIPFMLDNYPKSVQRSDVYLAQLNETFELDIDQPFLIEKVVCEIPMLFGSTWFDDLTVTSVSYASGTYAGSQPMPGFLYYDKGGPGMVFSLQCQKKYGQENIRDLVASEFITHERDVAGTNVARKFELNYTEGGSRSPFVIIEAFGSKKESCITVSKDPLSKFTGSIEIKSTCSISNGSTGLFNTTYIVSSSTSAVNEINSLYPQFRGVFFDQIGFLQKLRSVFTSEKISFSELGGLNFLSQQKFQVISIDAFGRGMTGFAPSGGSIFGKEYVTPQGTSKYFKNPFYLTGSYLEDSITQISSSLNQISSSFNFLPAGMDGMYVSLNCNPEYFSSKSSSPYLVNPGDKLLLTMSKTRPAISASMHNVPNSAAADIGFQNLKSYLVMTGSMTGHDVQFNTGSINITFYGSYVRAGNSYVP